MITVSFQVLVVGYILAGLLFFVFLWLYYDRRDRQFYDRQRIRHVYHCVKCDLLFSSRNPDQVDNCPRCGFENASLRF